MNNTARYECVTAELFETYKRKNHDYGNSFTKSYEEFGPVAAVVRMSDKMERLKSLCKKKAEVEESFRDTVMDLANYAIMLAIELEKKNDLDVLDKV